MVFKYRLDMCLEYNAVEVTQNAKYFLLLKSNMYIQIGTTPLPIKVLFIFVSRLKQQLQTHTLAF